MQTHQIYVSNGRDSVDEIRIELFVFPEVLDVFVTGRPDSLVVVCGGRPRPAQWLRALRAVGYELPRSQVGAHAENVDRTTVVAPLRCELPSVRTAQRCAASILRTVVLWPHDQVPGHQQTG